MKFSTIALTIACFGISNCIFANSELEIANQVAVDTAYAEQKAIWPGFHPNSMPIVIDFYAPHHAYALNFKPQSLPWQKLTSAKYETYYLADSNVLNLDKSDVEVVNVDGQLSYIYQIQINETPNIIWDRFWYYLKNESQINHSHDKKLNLSDDSFTDLNLVKLIFLERSILNLFLESTDASLRETLLRDALAVHQYRNSLSSNETRDVDNAWDVYYGTQAYVDFSANQKTEADFYNAVKSRASYGLCVKLEHNEMNPYNCREEMSVLTSAVYGHELDKLMKDSTWKVAVEKDFKSINNISIDNAHINNIQAKEITAAARKNPLYGYQNIAKFLHKELTPYYKEMYYNQHKFETLPGITLDLQGAGWVTAFMISSTSDYRINRNKFLFKMIRMAFTNHTFTKVPYAMVDLVRKGFNEIDYANSHTLFKISDNAILIINRNKILAKDFIAANKSITYTSLDIIEDNSKNIANLLYRQGVLSVSEGALKITANNQNDIETFNYRAYKQDKRLNKSL